jgi:23S rRNA (pseudouridine1915-N3)-methyltransferase
MTKRSFLNDSTVCHPERSEGSQTPKDEFNGVFTRYDVSLATFSREVFMKITVIGVGKLKEKYLKDAIGEYQKRLSSYCSLNIIEVLDEGLPENSSFAIEDKAKKTEADRIMKYLKQGSFVIVLDILGKKITSEIFAEKLGSLGLNGLSDITFVIGGSIGLHEDVLKCANFRFSMSDLTFPHQLVRLILLEQIYRAFKILKGEPYHK